MTARQLQAQVKALTGLVQAQAVLLTKFGAPSVPTITVREIYTAYEAARRADYSWITIRNRILPLVRRLGDLPAMELTSKKWREHRAARRLEPWETHQRKTWAKGKGPKETTLNLELMRAKTMLGWASSSDQGLIPSNPLAEARRENIDEGRQTSLSEPELQRLLAAPRPFQVDRRRILRAFVLICADAGLRLNEARLLRWNWIRSDGIVTLPKSITKSKKSRTVALTPRALAAIREVPKPEPEQPEVFVNPDTGRLYAETSLRVVFYEACESAGLRAAEGDGRVHIHDLRHQAATAAIRRGASAVAVQHMLGHSNLSITSRYLHHTDSDALELARLMQAGAEREGAPAPEGTRDATT